MTSNRMGDHLSDVVADPLLLGQRVIAIVEAGQRDATYKLATLIKLMALIDQCIESLPQRAEDVLRVPLPELARRVLSLYWPQVRPFEGQELRQRHTGVAARIPDAAKTLREATRSGNSGLSLDIAMIRAPRSTGRRSPRSRWRWPSNRCRDCRSFRARR